EDRARGLARGNVRGDARLVVTSHALQAAPPWSSALQLAAGEYVQLPTSDALKLGDHFTLEAWILPELTDDAYHGFLGHQPPGVGARSPSLWVYQRRRIHFVYGDGVGQQGGITEPVLSDTPGRWHHVAASYGDGVFKIYVDGVMVHTHQTSLPSINSPVGWIGRVDNFFSGAIADVRLWSRVRSDAEIYTDMRRRLWGQEPGLVAYWPLDDDSGQVARDRTEHGNHGTLTGPPRWRAAIALATTGVPSVEPPVIGALPSGQSSLGAPSGPSSEVQPIDLPSAVTNLGALEAEVFFVPFGLPIVFEGAVTVQPLEHAVSYAGKVTLTAPFQVTVDPLALALADGEDGPTWMVKFGMPQSRSISDVIQTDVLAQIPDVVRPAIEALVMPYLALYQHAIVILSNDDGEDEELGPYIAGVNLFATLPASTIPPLDLIHATFPQIGLDTRDVVLGVGASTAAQQNFFIGATLMLEVELGTPLVVLESLAFSLSRQVTDSTVGVLIAFRLNLAGELLKLRGGIELATGVGNSVSVWGALDADDGAWRDPFGVRGLTIVGLGVQVGATPTFPFVVIGVRGEVHIGDGLLGARVAIKVDASDWSKCILDLYSEEGIDLPALIGALTGGWLNVGSILAVRIKDLQLYIAPKGGTIAGVSYPPGLKIGGRLDLWGFQASVEGQLDFDQGGSLSGQIDPIVLAAGGVEFFRLSNVAGDGGASIDVVFTLSQVGGSVDGKLSLLGGVIASQVQATLTTSGFVATLSTGSWGIYQNASVALNAGRFRLSFGPSISVSVNIAGYNVGISVGTTITTEIDANSFSQAISFSFSAMGVSYSPGPFSISIPFQSVGQLADAFYQYARDLILGGLLGSIVQAAQIAFDWVKTNVTAAAQDVAKVFENVGASSVAIAQGLVTSFGIGAGEAVSYLSVGANEAAGILKDGFGWSVTQTGQWLKDVGGYTDTAVNSALNGAGYAANEVADFMGDVFGGSWIPHVDFPHWDHLDFNGY
ncbi:MAG: LamG domain-containing protein, partial [Myxococcales bacterium]|nr:LamG domain-containing protein [Myxococcales bacterium]